jgi:hypothetical protein
MAGVAQDLMKEKFTKQFGTAALSDCEKRIQFGHEWCEDGKFKFIYSGCDDGVSVLPTVMS